jgi:hypothetical protein
MLDVALDFLVKTVNAWLLLRTGSDFGKLELNRIVDDAGKWSFTKERIAVAVISIDEDRILKSHLPEVTLVGGQHVVLQPELKLNLDLLLAAHFTHYDQALKYTSLVLTYFQSHPSFKQAEYPALDPRIEKLNVELVSLGYEQLSQIWAFVGSRQLPSMVYRLRMVALQDGQPAAVAAPIAQIDQDVQHA